MNTWMVGKHPIAHLKTRPNDWEPKGSLVFFLKGRIMAGQADIGANTFGVTEFKWLTKDELKINLVDKLYSSVELSMPAQ